MSGLPRPLELEMLHHYYCCPTEFPRLDAPACMEAASWLARHRLIEIETREDRHRQWTITKRGEAHLLALLKVPLPQEHWVTPWEELACPF